MTKYCLSLWCTDLQKIMFFVSFPICEHFYINRLTTWFLPYIPHVPNWKPVAISITFVVVIIIFITIATANGTTVFSTCASVIHNVSNMRILVQLSIVMETERWKKNHWIISWTQNFKECLTGPTLYWLN